MTITWIEIGIPEMVGRLLSTSKQLAPQLGKRVHLKKVLQSC